MIETIQQIIGLVAGLLALILSLLAFISVRKLSGRIDELERSNTSSKKKRKKSR